MICAPKYSIVALVYTGSTFPHPPIPPSLDPPPSLSHHHHHHHHQPSYSSVTQNLGRSSFR
ncbi:hypothetical protein E2C01_051215 [Portunus trituberculatus]|uniref:Uncharacterized protein n=1 Tax=Portunus trituberculatus TaxID=210409 RepID=A0A5B7GJN8_PORTR|nr:hypothetical protein [Portunus trituberculatus]